MLVPAAVQLARPLKTCPDGHEINNLPTVASGQPATCHYGHSVYREADNRWPWEALKSTTPAASAAGADYEPPRLKLRSLEHIEAQPVEYLPGDVLLKSALQLVVGDPGLGKTRMLLEACANTTRGKAWPSGEATGEARHVFYIGHEDSAEHVIRPVVVEALGGDPTRFHLIDALEVSDRRKGRRESMFSLSEDGIEALDTAMGEFQPALIVVDPLTGHLGGADSFKDSEVRERLMPLARLAQKYGAGIIGNSHMNKDQQRAVAYRVGGSIAFYAVARAVFYMVQDPHDPRRRAFFHKKGNMAELAAARGLSIVSHYLDDTLGSVGVPSWDDAPVDFTLEEALKASSETEEAREKRESPPQQVLRSILLARGGKAPATEVRAIAGTMGIPDRTLDRAKALLNIVSQREGFGADSVSWWVLPAAAEAGVKWEAPR